MSTPDSSRPRLPDADKSPDDSPDLECDNVGVEESSRLSPTEKEERIPDPEE